MEWIVAGEVAVLAHAVDLVATPKDELFLLAHDDLVVRRLLVSVSQCQIFFASTDALT